ncbi:hypothetical protein OHB26_20200 [Nocardia sp. NBC_01503]|uniref:hypothetical protein n=1 Tax=Nocardia sp. NBC_01503 TaxID=2975997 RepID=UPI002E7B9A79|nr:hypothetical protein [Nocardia sp. NBC_01503]WTL29335.1 hypothetical protein OHB26_20200 [Nocardia sp. NBC_01503]
MRKNRIFTTVGAVVLISTSALLMTACNDKDTAAGPTSSQLAQPMGTGQPDGTSPGGSSTNGQATVRSIGKTGWYEGFDITVDKATVIPDEFGGAKVRIDITYKNTTTDNKTLSTVPTLLVGGQIDGGAGFDNPEVPGKGSAAGNVTTSVQKLSDAQHLLDTLTVVYGTAAENQTIIPLKADGKVESVAPKALTISGTLVQDQTTIQITGGTLTPSYTKGEHGKMDLALHVKIIGGSGIPDGGANIFYEYFSVKTPDGQSLPADDRGPINELLERNQTIDNAKDFAIFVVPSPGSGTYVLTYDATKGASTAPTFSFTVN